MPSAMLSIPSQSRNKLRTFVFEANAIEFAPQDDKENNNSQVSKIVAVASSPKSPEDDLEESSPQLPRLLSQKQCPQTPTNRIPLADLIGNTEDAFNCNPKDTTPEDHIYWQHGPTPRSSIPSATANSARRGNKRARSSSPPSSSQNHKSARSNAPEVLDLKTLHESLKTPQNDPALDLWARYTDASLMKKDVNGNALPAFAHLMTSSPQTQNGKDSGLRRSISCGIEWPASKAKRHKTNHEVAEGRVRDTLAASRKDIMATGKSKASRISLLMEKLQENSMKIPQIEVSGPSSSSPLPGRMGLPNLLDVSSVQRRAMAANEKLGSIPNADEDYSTCDRPERQQIDLETTSSEFGDEDLALEALEAFEAVEQLAGTHTALPVAGTNDLKSAAANNETASQVQMGGGDGTAASRPSLVSEIVMPYQESASQANGNVGRTAQPVATTSNGENDDEFGDESDDSGAMADLAAQFDNQERTHRPLAKTHVQHIVVEHNSSYINDHHPVVTVDDDAAYDDDDDLWNQIRDGSMLLEQNNGMVGPNQVCVI